jgi:asparagine synthase (glutamine-hydrolysing)
MTNYLGSDEKRALLASRPELPDSLDRLRADLARLGDAEPLHQLLYTYCQSWLAADLLAKADRMSMACSLELRTPFLDWRLVEWAARAPTRAKVGPDERGRLVTKRILRRWAARHLPASILARPKRGFPVPVYEWLGGALRPFVEDLLAPPAARLCGWLEPAALRRALSRGLAPEASMLERHRLANLLVLEVWMRRWLP